MKSDKIYYQLFQQNPALVFELLGQLCPEPYSFQATVVKEREFRLDGLLLPVSNNPEAPLIVLEFQMQPDSELYYRIFSELALYVKQYNCPNPWQVLVVYGDRTLEREVPQQPQINQALNLRRIYLNELEPGVSLGQDVLFLLGASREAVLQQGKRVVQQVRAEVSDPLEQRTFIELVADIITRKFPEVGDREVKQMLGLAELEHTKAYQEGLQEGLQEGKQKGLLEGERKLRTEAIPRLRNMGLSVAQVAEALDMSPREVQQFLESEP